MASIVSAGTTSATALNMSADTSGVLQLASNNGTVALTIATNQNVTLAAGLTIGTSISPAYLTPNGGPINTAAVTNNWWYIGSIVLVDSRSATLRIDGTQAYSAGVSCSGSTYLHLRGTNSASVLEGYFYGTTQGNSTVTGIAWKSTAGNTFDLWIKLQDYASGVVYCNTNGSYTPASTDTGSTTQPSGSTAFGSFWTVSTAGNERLRSDSGGNLMVNTTTPAQTASTNNVLTLKSAGVAAVWGVGPTTSFGTFYISNVGTGVALSQGSTSWGTVSDERLKDIIEPITDAVSKVSSLRSVIGKYKTDADDKRRSFLIAQDVQAVLPEAIDVGEDEDQMLSVKYTEVIPLLVAAINELNAKVTALENK